MIGDIFQKKINFQGFYIIYIIIWQFLGRKRFTPSKLDETGLQKMQNDESFFGEKPLKIAHGLNFAPKIIPDCSVLFQLLERMDTDIKVI